MCGVAGVFAYSSQAAPADRAELRAVRDHMAARGPDGDGEWFSPDGRVGLAHRRLAIIDLSNDAAQPMASADGQLVISFNGEIYNYRELKARLQAAGHALRTESDTEVILRLYEAHGAAMLPMLRGMFAFALWDARRGGMLLARDPFGVKPLYYANDGRTLRTASQVKALLRCPVDTSPDPAGHAGFFLWGSVPCPWTLYRGIRSLPAGHSLWVDRSGPSAPEAYFRISDVLAAAVAQPAQGSREDVMDGLKSALKDSVRAHLVADVPVGVFLSAGLDSAVIASAATDVGGPVRSITLGVREYAGDPRDEVPLAERIARQLDAEHTTLAISRDDFESERAKLLDAMDQPSIDGVNVWFVARAAASQGLKVALSGLGGDELFGTYPAFEDVPRITKWARPFSRPRAMGRMVRRLSEPVLRHFTSPKYAGLLEYGGSAGGAYLLRRGLFMPWELPRVMDPDMAREGWSALRPLARLDDAARRAARDPASHLAVTAMEMSWYMHNQLLRDADWAGMAHSLEIRVPFVDVPFVQAAAAAMARDDRITKREFARSVAPALPREWLDQPKSGFTVPVREWVGGTPRSTRGLRRWAQLVHSRHDGASVPGRRRVLVSTLAPGNGGVNAMTSFVVRTLAARGLEPVIAHYAPYSVTPTLSVPSYRLLQRRTDAERVVAYEGHEAHAIGAWLPELEFTHYAATRHWRSLMDSCDAFVAVSGNVLPATPFWQTGRRFVAWVATDWGGDRKDRVQSFPVVRRLLDTAVIGPVTTRLERKLLSAGAILPLSDYTSRMLARIAQRPVPGGDVLPIGVDSAFFTPSPALVNVGRVGFVGRFMDPRKNVGLFLETVALLRRRGHDVRAMLLGDTADAALLAKIRQLGLDGFIDHSPAIPHDELPQRLRALDVFVVPSHQEGLCIAALEAMACAVPVVSTRCGGPEEFVLDGETGALVDAHAPAMADAVWSIVADRTRRDSLGAAARRLVEQRYSVRHAETVLWRSLASAFPEVAAQAAMSPS